MLRFLWITTLTFLFAGCSFTPKYKVTIDAIKAPDINATPTTYTIKALDDKKDIDELKFQHYATLLSEVLHQKGYLKALPQESAKQNIYFDYGIEKLQEVTQSYIEPNIYFHLGWGYPYYAHRYNPFWNEFYTGGYRTYYRHYIYYNRYITIIAKEPFTQKELWRVDASSIGESTNLRKIIPLLIEATKPYIGTTTKEPVTLVIEDEK